MGIPVRCNHTVDSDVEELFEQVRREQGRIDLNGANLTISDKPPTWMP
jgi:hypothetical protein